LIEKDELLELIPHRGKMLLLTRVNTYSVKEMHICAEYHITPDCVFFDPAVGGVPSWVGFEFIAQAISALTGIRNRELGIKPRIGFILSISSIKMKIPLFKPGSCVELRVKQKDATGLIYTFTGEAFLEGKKVIEGKLMVMEINEEDYSMLCGERKFN
jgi:3-hydroxymyristoyl/3-hydroxydecanoyl-(acyl carrier protein) dehydratase